MQSFETFMESRKNLNFSFKVRNFISFLLISFLAYSVFQALYPKLTLAVHQLMLGMILVSSVLCMMTFILKIRFVMESRKNNESLHEYMSEAIKQARTNRDYSVVNQLLDSKYSTHMILVMSKYPLSSFDFTQLSKWEKLPSALKYFQDNKFSAEDLIDSSRMTDYLKTVYPEFLKALAESKNS